MGRDDELRDIELERLPLGDIMVRPTQCDLWCHGGLVADLFSYPAHRDVWAAVQRVHGRGVEPDMPAVHAELRASRQLHKVGSAYLAQLPDGVPRQRAENINAAVAQLRRLSIQRAARDSTRNFLRQLRRDGGSANNGALRQHIADLVVLEQGDRRSSRASPLIDDVDMIQRPEPPGLIAGMVLAGSLAALYGGPGVGKTFVAVHVGVCITTGRACFGAPVPEPGHVVHVLGEGAGRFGIRLAAAKAAIGVAPDKRLGYFTKTEPVDMLSAAAVTQFIIEARAVSPRLVIIDTVNRCMPVGNESATEDMTRFVAHCDRLRAELDAAVLLIHHSGWDDTRERGSTVLRGAVDTLMALKRSAELTTTLSCEKQRDLDVFPDIALRRVAAGDSCVLELAADPPTVELTTKERCALDALTDQYDGTNDVPSRVWRQASLLTERTFERAKKDLLARGHVQRVTGGRYRPGGA